MISRTQKTIVSFAALLLVTGGIGAVAYAQYFQPSALPGQETVVAEEKPLAPLITVEELRDKIVKKENFVLIDARSPEAFAKEHIKEAINIPFKELEGKLSTLLPLDREIVTMCNGDECELSTKTATKLLESGFTNVKNYDGGIARWKLKGYVVVSDEPAQNN